MRPRVDRQQMRQQRGTPPLGLAQKLPKLFVARSPTIDVGYSS